MFGIVTKWKDKLRRKLLNWLLGDSLSEIRREVAAEVFDYVRDYIAPIQAIDCGIRDPGKIILMVRVRNQDIVKIIDLQVGLNMQDYLQISREIEARYGARLRYADVGSEFRHMFINPQDKPYDRPQD